MKDFIIFFYALALSAALIITPIVLACVLSPLYLFFEIVTFPFAVVFFVGAISV